MRTTVTDVAHLSRRRRLLAGWIGLLLPMLALLVTAPSAATAEDEAGAPSPADLRLLDRVIEQFMAEHSITAATFALSIDGHIVYTSAYGHRDAEAEEPVMPYATFRLASVAKPITAAVVQDLIAEGRLAMNTPVFRVVEMDPPDGAEPDPRLERITIGHLLHHRGGWDRAVSGDPMFQDAAVRDRLGLNAPPQAEDIIRFMLTRPLDFDPGARVAYSNFGYCLLGRAVEAVTGKSFTEVVLERIAAPTGMTSLALGHTYARDRNADEVHYPIRDGDLHIERMDAHGGLIASAPDLCRFMAHYWISGEPRQAGPRGEAEPAGHGRSYGFFGAMPGTLTLIRQHPSGIDYALLMNRFPPEFRDILTRLDEPLETAGLAETLRHP